MVSLSAVCLSEGAGDAVGDVHEILVVARLWGVNEDELAVLDEEDAVVLGSPAGLALRERLDRFTADSVGILVECFAFGVCKPGEAQPCVAGAVSEDTLKVVSKAVELATVGEPLCLLGSDDGTLLGDGDGVDDLAGVRMIGARLIDEHAADRTTNDGTHDSEAGGQGRNLYHSMLFLSRCGVLLSLEDCRMAKHTSCVVRR